MSFEYNKLNSHYYEGCKKTNIVRYNSNKIIRKVYYDSKYKKHYGENFVSDKNLKTITPCNQNINKLVRWCNFEDFLNANNDFKVIPNIDYEIGESITIIKGKKSISIDKGVMKIWEYLQLCKNFQNTLELPEDADFELFCSLSNAIIKKHKPITTLASFKDINTLVNLLLITTDEWKLYTEFSENDIDTQILIGTTIRDRRWFDDIEYLNKTNEYGIHCFNEFLNPFKNIVKNFDDDEILIDKLNIISDLIEVSMRITKINLAAYRIHQRLLSKGKTCNWGWIDNEVYYCLKYNTWFDDYTIILNNSNNDFINKIKSYVPKNFDHPKSIVVGFFINSLNEFYSNMKKKSEEKLRRIDNNILLTSGLNKYSYPLLFVDVETSGFINQINENKKSSNAFTIEKKYQDIEFENLIPINGYLMSLSYVLISSPEEFHNYKIKSFLVKPFCNYEVITDVHNLTWTQCTKYGESLSILLNDWNQSKTIISYNIEFDYKVLMDEMLSRGHIVDSKITECVMKKIYSKFGLKSYKKLETSLMFYGIDPSNYNLHSSEDDLEAALKLFILCNDDKKVKNSNLQRKEYCKRIL